MTTINSSEMSKDFESAYSGRKGHGKPTPKQVEEEKATITFKISDSGYGDSIA